MTSVNLLFEDNHHMYFDGINVITEKRYIESNLDLIDIKLVSIKLIIPKHQLPIDMYNTLKYDKHIQSIDIDNPEFGMDTFKGKFQIHIEMLNSDYQVIVKSV